MSATTVAHESWLRVKPTAALAQEYLCDADGEFNPARLMSLALSFTNHIHAYQRGVDDATAFLASLRTGSSELDRPAEIAAAEMRLAIKIARLQALRSVVADHL
ncbi:MAG TPA: hypothetical protein VMZ51_08240 [Acidimicrobiales bacterium]|nr:hypothetical protein [Acidimicrobiales bacterium]